MDVKIVDIFKRLVKWDKKLAIYANGEDNAYPERCERLKNNSVTAKMASNKMVQYLLGNGFGEADNLEVGKNLKLIDFADDIATDIVDNRGVFIHVNYNGNFQFSSFKVLPFSWCRLGEKDDKEYNGKILVKKDWNDNKETPKVIDVFNPLKEVVASQISKAGSIENYKGQIFYFNMDRRFYYPLSRIDSVMNDCDSESQSSVYKNQLLRKGFFGRTVCITRTLTDSSIEETYLDANGNRIANPEYVKMESEAEQVKATIEEFLGAENAGGAMVIQTDFAGENLEDAFLFKNIESNIQPDLFQNVEDSLRSNILVAYNNLPVGLVKSSEGIFSNSGEAILEMKKTYWEDTSKERNILETIVNDLLKGFADYNGGYVEIKSLLEQEANVDVAEQKKIESQATLKGSVGGVQALLQIQQSVANDLTDAESAVTIISEIYGIDENLARKMLGTPELNNDDTITKSSAITDI